MAQNTNLNVSPYFDDFDENKNYKKVLFKPGFPIQSRELNTLQSILQDQTEKFGKYFFKEGSVVIPGSTFYDDRYFAVRIDPYFLNIPVKEYTNILASKEIQIKGETSGVTATVINRIVDTESIDSFDTLYVKYKSEGTKSNIKTFIDGENLIALSDIDYSLTKISANSSFAKCINSNATKIGSSASINEGVYFIRGYFVKVQKETIILDQYSNTPSYRIGLLVNEEIISASSENPDLFDNAQGFSNESAPGADRFKISVNLHKKDLTDLNDQNFVELIRVENGLLQKFVNKTELNIFKDELARRTSEESGDYYITPFSIDVRESLNDRILNRGVYLENQLTQNGNTPSDDIFVLQISPGKAYVKGYDIEKYSTTSLDSVKPRTTNLKSNVSLPVKIGNIVKVNNILGSPKIGFSTTYTVSLLDSRLDSNRLIGSASTIGIARVYDFNQISSSGLSTTQYELRLFDIQTYTTVKLGLNITASSDSYIKGQYSGATGFLKNSVSSGSTLTIYDTKGSFAINEPIIVNGIDVGRNIISIRDYDFSDIKSVYANTGITTFAADFILQNKKVFTEASIFTITPGSSGVGTVTSPSISDFNSLVKVGDILQYSRPGFSTVTYNKVSSVSANKLSIVGVSTVAGLCDGDITGTNLSVIDFDVVIPSLNDSTNPGYKIGFENKYISSINLLDSSYIIRKQISKNITSSTFTFYLSDLGDNNIYFELFNENKYILTWETGQKETLTNAQISFSTNLREMTISGLSRTGNATLTCTVKRTSLSSKDKKLIRCNQLIVNKSKYSGSGIGSTTFNDGLTYSSIYGTRVQDEEISLNYPDIYRILAIFESNDSNDPTIPSLTVSNQSNTFINYLNVGEKIIGNSSGAIARVVSVVSSNQITFVYENEKTFGISETITFKTSSIVATINNLIVGDRNIVSNYALDAGHRLEYVDYGRVVRKSNSQAPTKKISIIFDYYENNEGSGTVESINSYKTLNYSNEIPLALGVRASDYIDLRPRVAPYSTSSTTSPFSFSSRNFSSSSSETTVSNETIVVDYSYYLGRIDRIYLNKDGTFEVIKGQPSDNPKLPLQNNTGFEVAVISMNPYVINASIDCTIKTVPHKRYTMSDIGDLETRIKTLEDYTTLSLLETDTKNLSIKDPNTGLDKFKSGFFVDTFRNHNNHNFSGESQFDIDKDNGECRPKSAERNVPLIFETKSSISNPTNADYRWIGDFESENIVRNDAGLTLKYKEVEFITQNLASRTENINPFHIALYAGSIELTPASDFWIEEIHLGTPDTIKDDSQFIAAAKMYGVSDRENGGMASSYWNSHETTWTGKELIKEELINSDIISSGSVVVGAERRNQVPAQRNVYTQTDILSNDYLQTYKNTGVDKTFGINLTAGEKTISLGNKVIATDVLYNCRSRNIEVVGNKLKPNTRYYVFFENTDVTEYCVPKLLPITMKKGSFSTSDILVSKSDSQSTGNPKIKCRVAQLNHKFGPYNSPTVSYNLEPYNSSTLGSSYSSTSSILNIDTADLALLKNTDHSGWVKKGSELVNVSGTAEAAVGDIVLKSDEKGTIIFTLFIPDPKIKSNPKFTTGKNTIRITTSPTNANQLDPGESSAEAIYSATGQSETIQEQILSIKTVNIERKQIGNDQPITQITQNLDENRKEIKTSTTFSGWYDPLAQSFLVEKDKYPDGVFLTGGEVYFKTKDEVEPVTVQIRTMQNGSPTGTILPFGQVQIDPNNIPLSTDGSAATKFNFQSPIYLQPGSEYALVLVSPTSKYLTFTTRVGEEDYILGAISNKQPYMGSLFKSQNGSTWDPSQYEDLKFKLFKAEFVTNTPSSFIFYNADLENGKILKENPVTAYSKRQYISIANTSIAFAQGNTLTQSTSYGDIFSYGGPVGLGTTTLTVSSSGIGLTDGTFSNIGFSPITGYGSSCVATVTILNGSVTNFNVTNGGSGYGVGDLILANQLGNTGTGVRATVGIVSTTNLLVVDDVFGTFNTSSSLTFYNSANSSFNLASPTSVNNDPIRDGYTLLFDHVNHGMHSSSNKVKVVNFCSDTSPTILSSDITSTSTSLTVSNAGILTSFEGSSVGSGNTGYLLIDNEIIAYNDVTGNNITIVGRGIDSSIVSTHNANSLVYTYQFDSVSLRKINKTHNIDPREKTFNSYYLKLSDTSKSFKTTKSGGGKKLEVSQNIPFEVISPRISAIMPSGTNISARIKTISGTSISGNEASFNDQGYENVSLNKLNYLNSPRIVASKVNEYDLLSNTKSFGLEMTLSTTKKDVSPFIDLNTANVILISNLVDDKVDDFKTDSRCKIPGSDPNSAIYETNKIDLEFPSNSLQIQFDGHRKSGGDIRVMYKLYRNDNSDFQQIYTPFNSDGTPDKIVNPNTISSQFSEYKFTAENLPQFNGFMIKVIMTSNDQSKPPKIKNFRSIALRSYSANG
jgi:hypothetical protein